MTRDIASNVRAAAAALAEAIDAAEAAGLRVEFPDSRAGLTRIAISETGRVLAAVAEVPTPTAEVVLDVRPAAAVEMPVSGPAPAPATEQRGSRPRRT